MPAVQRKDDANDVGAKITAGVDSVRVNNLPISVDGSPVEDHSKKKSYDHKSIKTANGVSSVRVNNKPVNVRGNADTCNDHKRVGGSDNVTAGGA